MKKGKNTKRSVAVIIAVLALIVTTLGGTFAYQDYKQHKSNELNGEAIKYEARLVEDFAEVDDWKVEDGAITKKISVVNLGQAPGYGDVYVRIQLKEYMEIGSLAYQETTKRYMIDTEGEFIVYANQSDAITATAAGGLYAGHSIARLTDVVTGASGWFIETMDHDPNGQMGKYVITGVSVGNPEAVISSGPQVKAANTNHHSFPSDECNYAIHTWKPGATLETREFIEWQLNTGAIITFSEWNNPAGLNGMPVDKWVIDDTSDEGWVYWGRALETESSTALFMESVTLVKQPEGFFYYVIHTDMQAVSLDELISGDVDWGDAGGNFIKNKPSLAWDGPTPTQVAIGSTVNSPGVISKPNAVAPGDLVWTSSNTSLATVNQNGVVTGVVAGGPVTITATAPNGAKVFYTLFVVPGGTTEIPATGITINDGDLAMNIGDDHQIDFTVQPGNTTDTPSWSSSNPDVATVDENGKVTAVGDGETVITITIGDKQESIKVTVLPDEEDTNLPTKEVPGGGYKPNEDPMSPMNGDGLYVKIDYQDLTNPNNNVYYHDGSIHLENIISDGNYTGVTATPKDSKYAGKIYAGTDKHGKPSIIYTYVPSEAELRDWMTNHPDEDIFFSTQVELTRTDGKSATVTILMYYWYSSMSFS